MTGSTLSGGPEPSGQAIYHLKRLFETDDSQIEVKRTAVEALNKIVHHDKENSIPESYERAFTDALLDPPFNDKELQNGIGLIVGKRWPTSTAATFHVDYMIEILGSKAESLTALQLAGLKGFLAGLGHRFDQENIRLHESVTEIVEKSHLLLSDKILKKDPEASLIGVKLLKDWFKLADRLHADIDVEKERMQEGIKHLDQQEREAWTISLTQSFKTLVNEKNLLSRANFLGLLAHLEPDHSEKLKEISLGNKISDTSSLELEKSWCEIIYYENFTITVAKINTDREAALAKLVADDIREQNYSPKSLILDYLKDNQAQVVSINSVSPRLDGMFKRLFLDPELKEEFTHIGIYVGEHLWDDFIDMMDNGFDSDKHKELNAYFYNELTKNFREVMLSLYDESYKWFSIAPDTPKSHGELKTDAIQSKFKDIFNSDKSAKILIPGVYPHCLGVDLHSSGCEFDKSNSLFDFLPEGTKSKAIISIDYETSNVFGQTPIAAIHANKHQEFAGLLRKEGILNSFGLDLQASTLGSVTFLEESEKLAYKELYDGVIGYLGNDGKNAKDKGSPRQDTGVDKPKASLV